MHVHLPQWMPHSRRMRQLSVCRKLTQGGNFISKCNFDVNYFFSVLLICAHDH